MKSKFVTRAELEELKETFERFKDKQQDFNVQMLSAQAKILEGQTRTDKLLLLLLEEIRGRHEA